MDDLGNVVNDPNASQVQEEEPADKRNEDKKANNKYKSTDNYKPTGKFVYNSDLFDKIERKVRFD